MQTGLGDAGYFGGADTFMQRPTHANDRRLLAAGGLCRFDRYPREGVEQEEGGDAGGEGDGGVDAAVVGDDTVADGTEFLTPVVSEELLELGTDVVSGVVEKAGGARIVGAMRARHGELMERERDNS